MAAALPIARLPEHAGLSGAGSISLAITVLASGLWISDALPPFAVALLVIALHVFGLGGVLGPSVAPGDPGAWQIFLAPWASAPLWIFLAGLMLARAGERAGIAAWFAEQALA